jgi:hypothetical protein
MLPFGAEPFVLLPAVKNCDGYNIQDYNFARGFMSVKHGL